MKKLFFFILLLSICSLVSAQENYDAWQKAEGTLEGVTVGSSWFTYVSDANLRSGPSTTADAVAKLPIATKVIIDAISTDSLTLRGVRMPWLLVHCEVNGTTQKGYVWGGFMALASIQTPNEDGMPNAGVIYLTGVSAYDENKHEIMVQIRAAKNNQMISKIEFTTVGDLSYYPNFEVGFEPLKNVEAVLTVNYYYPACGYPSGNNLVFLLKDNTMVKVLETSSVSEGGVFYSAEEYILPSQRGGIGDHIIVTHDLSTFEEKGNDYVRSKQEYKIILHKWNGAKLVKMKEIK